MKDGVWIWSGMYMEDVLKVCGRCLEGGQKVPGRCLEDVWMVFGMLLLMQGASLTKIGEERVIGERRWRENMRQK